MVRILQPMKSSGIGREQHICKTGNILEMEAGPTLK